MILKEYSITIMFKYMITSSQLVTKALILLIMIYILHEASCILFQSKFMFCS